jgi:hypothetical protein
VAATHPPAALLEAGADVVVRRLGALRVRVAESDPRLIVETG